MRTFAISTMFLVFALISGACAGRQVRTRSMPAPSLTVHTASAPAPAPVAEALAADEAPAIEMAHVEEPAPTVAVTVEPKLTTQPSIDMHVADESVVAPKIDAARGAATAAKRPHLKPRAASAAVEDGAAVVGSLALAPPAPALEDTAPAAPSIVNASPGTPNVLTAASSAQRASPPESPAFFVLDRDAVEQHRNYASAYMIGAIFAAFAGILLGLFLAWGRDRRLKALAAKPYAHLPEGTVLMQEVVGGELVTRQVFCPAPPEPRSEPEASEQAATMETIERTWHAEGEAMQEESLPKKPPLNDEAVFDFTDTPAEPLPAPAPPATPSTEPKTSDVQPRLASGSGQIISSADGASASGTTPVPEPPPEPRSEPEFHAKVIVYEDDSLNPPAMTATATPN